MEKKVLHHLLEFSLKLFEHFYHFYHNDLHFLFYQNNKENYFHHLKLRFAKRIFPVSIIFLFFINKNFIHNLKTIFFSYISLKINLKTINSCKFNNYICRYFFFNLLIYKDFVKLYFLYKQFFFLILLLKFFD